MTTTRNRKPTVSAEEKAARLEAAHTAIATQVATLRSSEAWRRMLDFSARFHTYSFSNQMWLLAQAETRGMTLSRVAGFGTWKSLGRNVVAGSKGLRVLAPIVVPDADRRAQGADKATKIGGWKTATVFDASQTEGEPLPSVEHGTAATSTPDGLLVTLSGIAAALGFPWRYGDGNGAEGYALPASGGATGEIVVDVSMTGDEARTVAVLLHEIAHIMLGHTDPEHDYRAHRGVSEVEAESVAYVVGSVVGVEMGTSSFAYVAGWGDEHDVVATGNRVQRTAKALLERIEA